MPMNPIFAFDFSMNKPAMASLVNNELSLYVWPLNIDVVSENKLTEAGIIVHNRNLSPIKDNTMNEHTLIYEHVTRAKNLADTITSDIMKIRNAAGGDPSQCYISNEGLSFGSKGDATLDLSGYKYILMSRLIQMGFVKLMTYAPITIKKTAGCSKKGTTKLDMINAVGNEEPIHPFISMLKNNPENLKKKTAFVQCVDDICDAYWCLKTTIAKENLA